MLERYSLVFSPLQLYPRKQKTSAMKAKVVYKSALKVHQTNNRSIIAPSGFTFGQALAPFSSGILDSLWPVAAVSQGL